MRAGDSNHPTESASEDRAEQVFVDYLVQLERGEPLSINHLCRDHPDLAQELRELEADRIAFDRAATLFPPVADSKSPESISGVVLPSHLGARKALVELELRSPKEWPFSLRREIGRGTFGVVEEVSEEGLRRRVAKKTLHRQAPSAPSGGGRRREDRLIRFLEEAQILGQLNHPGIVTIHAMGVDPEGSPYFTMQLVKGIDFSQVIGLTQSGESGWSLPRALEVVLKVCDALSYAHSRGVIHRDLKPAHLRIGRFGETYILDWGLARVLGRPDRFDLRIRTAEQSEDQSQTVIETDRRDEGQATPGSPLCTMDGTAIGTPSYMSPEQARGDLDAVGPASDVYSVGAILYHLLTGQPPFVVEGSSPAPLVVHQMLLNGPPKPLHECGRSVPPEIQAICEKAMARDIAARYSRMEEFAADLRNFLEGRVVHAYETGATAELRKWVLRNRRVASLAGAAFVMTILASVLLVAMNLAMRESERVTALLSANGELILLREGVKGIGRADAKSAGLYRDKLRQLTELRDRLNTFREAKQDLQVHGNQEDGQRYNPRALNQRASVARWVFEDPKLQTQYDGLDNLVASLELACAEPTGLLARLQRLTERAETIQDSELGAAQSEAWDEAIDYIAARFGLTITKQVGLIPLGPDPESGFYEFLLWGSGATPERGLDGRFVITAETGMVFIFLPGGNYELGARKEFEDDYESDEVYGADHDTVPVKLGAFFVSKYELTRGQWGRMSRISDVLDSAVDEANPQDAHPVAEVSWLDARELLAPYGLDLPSEAQHEYSMRGGEDGAFPFLFEDMRLYANVADLALKKSGKVPGWFFEEWDDGASMTASVGEYLPNAFGLHDVSGNVYEWCLDEYRPLDQIPNIANPSGVAADLAHSLPFVPIERVVRGGNFYFPANFARSANRFHFPSVMKSFFLGVRPVRPLLDEDWGG